MVDSNVTVLSLTRSGYISLVCAGFESWGCEVELSCCVLQFAVARRPFC